jgi:hypothetical protein
MVSSFGDDRGEDCRGDSNRHLDEAVIVLSFEERVHSNFFLDLITMTIMVRQYGTGVATSTSVRSVLHRGLVFWRTMPHWYSHNLVAVITTTFVIV